MFSHAERDRRWRIAQELLERERLAALVVYGERDGVGQPFFTPDVWFTNDRTGSVVIVPRGEDPYVLVNFHLSLGDHAEARRNGDDLWIPPERMFAGAPGRPGAGRSGQAIVGFLREHGLDRGRLGVIGADPFGTNYPDGVMPYGTLAAVREACPEAEIVPAGTPWVMATLAKSDEELAVLRHCARAGEAMCAAMVEAAAPGVTDQEVYAAGMEACFRAGAMTHWMILVVAAHGRSVGWGPPPWAYRPQRPRTLRSGDTILVELFPAWGMLETQQQLTIAVGDVHPDVERAAEVARASYEAGLATLAAGRTFGELAEAMTEPVAEAGGWNLTPHVHSLNPLVLFNACGFPPRYDALRDYASVGGVQTNGADVVLERGMVLAFEPNCVIGDRRVNIGGSVAVAESGAEELNEIPNWLQPSRG